MRIRRGRVRKKGIISGAALAAIILVVGLLVVYLEKDFFNNLVNLAGKAPEVLGECNSCESCTQMLNGSYSEVKLNSNIIDYSTGDCVVFGTNNAIFDCQGYTVDGIGSNYGILVSDKSGNNIKNCVVSDFSDGIRLHGSSFNNVINNILLRNSDRAILIESFSNNNNVSNNNISSSQGYGILIYDTSSFNKIEDNFFSNNIYGGIGFSSSSQNTIIDNDISGSKYGIRLTSTSNNNNIQNNIICSNTDYDIYNQNTTSGNTGTNNKCDKTDNWNDAAANGCTYFCSSPPIANLTYPSNNSVINNEQNISFQFIAWDREHSTFSCSLYLDMVLSATNPSVSNNTLTSLQINNIPYGSHNWYVICNDGFVSGTSLTYYFNLSDTIAPTISTVFNTTNMYDATIQWNTDENANSKVTYGLTSGLGNSKSDSSFVTSHSIIITGLSSNTVYYYNITSCDIYNNCNTAGVYTFTTKPVGVIIDCSSCTECSELLDGSYSEVRLATDITGTSGEDCINLGADNITFNCNSHRITGLRNSVGILSDGKSEITIKNCIITNWTNGISFTASIGDSINNIFYNNAVLENKRYGLYLQLSSYNSIYDNIFCANSDEDIYNFGAYSAGYNNTCNKTYNWNDDGTTNCTYICNAAPFPYCGDGSCNNGETCSSCPADCNPCSSEGEGGDGGGEGGGGGGTPTLRSQNFTFNGTIEKITVNYYSAYSTVVKVAPISKFANPPGIVYEFFSINSTRNITNATIYFKVDKNWINSHNIDFYKVKMYRYSNGLLPLQTILLNEDSYYFKYNTFTTGMSIFAISGESVSSSQPSQQNVTQNATIEQPKNVTLSQKNETSNITIESSKEGFLKNNWLYLLIGFIVIVALIIVAFFVRKSKEEFGVEELEVESAPEVPPEKLEQLKEFVLNSRKSGYSVEQIHTALINAGWENNLLDKVLKVEKEKVADTSKKSEIASYDNVSKQKVDELNNFIKQAKQKGYTNEQIHKLLIDGGWDEKLVSETLQNKNR